MPQSVFTNTREGLRYTLYLALGVLSLFLLANTTYTLLLGILWQYTPDYLINLALISIAALISTLLCLLTCYWMVKAKPYSHYTGLAAAVLLLFAPSLSILTDTIIHGITEMMLMSSIATLAIILLTIIFWWKSRQ